MKQIKPKQQGDFDGLCGVHAIINALYALDPTLSKKQRLSAVCKRSRTIR